MQQRGWKERTGTVAEFNHDGVVQPVRTHNVGIRFVCAFFLASRRFGLYWPI